VSFYCSLTHGHFKTQVTRCLITRGRHFVVYHVASVFDASSEPKQKTLSLLRETRRLSRGEEVGVGTHTDQRISPISSTAASTSADGLGRTFHEITRIVPSEQLDTRVMLFTHHLAIPLHLLLTRRLVAVSSLVFLFFLFFVRVLYSPAVAEQKECLGAPDLIETSKTTEPYVALLEKRVALNTHECYWSFLNEEYPFFSN